MNSHNGPNTITSSGMPVFEPDPEVTYTSEVIASLAGMDSVTVLHYQEMGVLSPRPGEGALFDDEALRRLRRIHHLRTECGVNDAGIRLILTLMDEVEMLQEERRQRRHL